MDKNLTVLYGEGLTSLLLIASFLWTRLSSINRERTRELRAERTYNERFRRARAAELAAERDDNERLRGHVHELRSLLASHGIPAPHLPSRPAKPEPDPDPDDDDE